MTIFFVLAILAAGSEPVTVHFFYSPDCGHCMDMLLGDIPALQAKYRFIFKKYDMNVIENYRLLEEMEAGVDTIGDDIPVIFVADSVFYGPKEAKERLEPTLKLYTRKKPAVHEDTVKIRVDTVVIHTAEINLYYFYHVECPECRRFEVLLNGLKKRYPDMVVHRHDMFDDSSKVLYEAIAGERDVPEKKRLVAPAVFVGDDYLIKDISAAAFEALVMKYQDGSPRLDSLRNEYAEKNIFRRFARFSIFGIIAAGFLDGINPCAFATIIFFVSYLLFLGRRRRDIIIMSVSFIAAVFASYLAIGLGAYSLLRFLAQFEIVGRIIFLIFGIAALVLGVLSLYDFFAARAGKTNRMILQLPLGIKQRIHEGIKEKTRVGGIVTGSLVAGFLISFLEFGCTGQVYLPTITFVISRAGFALKPVFALVIYNLVFIIPLAVIALLGIIFTTKNIAISLEKKIPMIKILTAILFFGLGILLILSV
jgi:cytochrome c biogenesis protein CcdA